MHDAFISYRREKGFAIAKMLRELLKAKGISAYVDLDELRSGTFDDKLLTAIKTTPAFILILTPSSLDRCGEDDDWLTKEAITAIDSGRNIIPVLCEGFSWPKHWDDSVPEKIRMLSNFNSVYMEYRYIDATVDTIIEYIHEDGADEIVVDEIDVVRPKDDIRGFFNKHLQDIENVVAVDLAFHAGSVWHQSVDRLDTIQTLAEAGVEIRVIVNTPEVATFLERHTRHKLKKYMPFEEAIERWRYLESVYENIHVKVTDIPMMRIQYTIRKKDSSKDAMRIKYYTHGVSQMEKNYIQEYDSSDYQYELYRGEFDYVWEHTEDN
ncbi:MAG: toll/interleukin-1 receptor domain-containing protein [Ruminococcus sp.]|nr:toll/interleukin-1 receptor domain-containing protein [Ruminococcus sp.]